MIVVTLTLHPSRRRLKALRFVHRLVEAVAGYSNAELRT
jgi:hypothetical protein